MDLSTSTIVYLADLLRSRLKSIRSPFRSLPPGRIAVFVLAMLRHDQRLLDLAGGNGVPESSLRRWRDEMGDLLAAQAPRLDRALRNIARRGGEAVLIDGTLIPTQRRTGKANPRNCSGKHHRHGLHFLALTDEKGKLIWISAARPGRTHDATAARRDKIVGPRFPPTTSTSTPETRHTSPSDQRVRSWRSFPERIHQLRARCRVPRHRHAVGGRCFMGDVST
ncbi:transposase family protein [Streptomyces sp. NPDC059161]|uniref:transposase family protein n=1 Tax=Streptomyces sp. NPDC059161 TaxID=3346749 RepID=UPI0036CEDA49